MGDDVWAGDGVGGGLHLVSNGRQGQTPLIIATYNGHLEVMQVLVAAGADLEAKDNRVRRRPLRPSQLGCGVT